MLDISEKQKTRYCIDDWLRDEQIKINCTKNVGRFQVATELREDAIAIAGFGPSLEDTWHKIREFRFLITCSGAHKFLLKKGLAPGDFEKWFHAEVDPRDHKIELLGKPHPGIHYLPCSAVHPTYLDHLVTGGATMIDLWHSFVTQDESLRVLPTGEWATAGGQDVVQRAIVLARLMGFRKMHLFGVDGCFQGLSSHAAPHPKYAGKSGVECEYPEGSNIFYLTTPSMLECAKNLPREIDALHDVDVTLYGEGLTQAIMRDHKKKAVASSEVAFIKPALISDEYRKLNAQLHQSNPHYGTSGEKAKEQVLALARSFKTTSVLDYGCGKGRLAASLPFPIWEYDPAIPGKEATPRPADIVVCGDVLEHIEPEHLDDVLEDLKRCVLKVGYFVVHTGPAQKVLADGRNAHLIQQNAEWWKGKLSGFFEVAKIETTAHEARFVVGQRKQEKMTGHVVEHRGSKIVLATPNDMTKWRAQTLITKEPTTIKWIETFQPGEVMWDVGACIAGFSTLAGKHKGVECYAFEPAGESYALAARNLRINNVKGAAFPLAITDADLAVSRIYLSTDQAGSSCNSFGAKVGPDLKPREGIEQGAVGMSVDRLVELGIPAPHHIKIDVDGMEPKVVRGMAKLLAGSHLKSILVEVNSELAEHREMIAAIERAGFTFSKAQAQAARRKSGPFTGVGEVVFTRLAPLLEVEAEVIEKIRAADLKREPFPHLYLEDVFPQDFYRYMGTMLPIDGYRSLEEARGTLGYPQRSVAPAPDCVKWMRSGRLRAALDEKFGVESLGDETILMRDGPGYKINPHTDATRKAVTALFYLTRDWSDAEHGTSIYVPKEPLEPTDGKHMPREKFDLVWTAPGKPNSVFIFARTENSFHGCEPYAGEKHRDILLYDTRR